MADTRGIRAGRAFVELGVSDRLTAGLKAAQQRLAAFGAGVRAVGVGLAGVGGAALSGLFAAAKSFSDAGDVLDKAAIRTGISVEALSELAHAAELSGADLATLENGVRVMQRTLTAAADGTATATDALARLGLTAADVAGMSPEEQFKLLADRVSRIEDPTLRAAAAMELFGKSGTKLLPLLEGGAEGIEALQQEARRLGLTVSTQTAKEAAALNDALGSMWSVLRRVVFTVGSALAPMLTDLANRVARVGAAVIAWLQDNRALIVQVFRIAAVVAAAGLALIALGTAIAGVGAVMGLLASVVSGVIAAVGAAGAAIAAVASPIGIAIAAVVALGGTLLVTTGAGGEALAWLMERFRELGAFVGSVVQGISDALAAGDIALAAEILWLSLKLVWQRGVAELNRAWLAAREFFVSTAQEMWHGAVAAAEIAFHALEVAWIETTSFLSTTWTRFAAGFRRVWESASAFVAKRMLEIQGLFDRGLDVDAAKAEVDRQLESRLAEVEGNARAAIDARERERQRQRDDAAATHEATLAAIGRDFEGAQDTLRKDTEAGLAESQAALDEARRKLAEAVEQARERREAAESAPGPQRSPRDLLGEFEDRLAGLGEQVARGISVTGTFSAAAVSGLGTGSAAIERTATATEQTARNTKRLADAAQSGGLRFA